MNDNELEAAMAKDKRDMDIGVILSVLGHKLRKHQSLRLGQLLSNLVKQGEDLYYLEDADTLSRLTTYPNHMGDDI